MEHGSANLNPGTEAFSVANETIQRDRRMPRECESIAAPANDFPRSRGATRRTKALRAAPRYEPGRSVRHFFECVFDAPCLVLQKARQGSLESPRAVVRVRLRTQLAYTLRQHE